MKKSGLPYDKELSEVEIRILKRIARKFKTRQGKTSVASLSLESELARSTINKILKGERDPRLSTLRRLAKALGYKNLAELFDEVDS